MGGSLPFSSTPHPTHKHTPGASLLALGRADGSIDVMDTLTGAVTATVAPAVKKSGAVAGGTTPTPTLPAIAPRGLAFLPHSAGTGSTRMPLLVAADGGGEVRLLAPSGEGGDDGHPSTYTLAGRLAGPSRPVALSLHAPTCRAAFACDGGEAGVWDLATRQPVFKAKGEKPDSLGMVDPAGGASVLTLGGADGDGRVFAVGTGRGRVRLYDARHGARPVAAVAPAAAGAGGAASRGTRRAITALAEGAGGSDNPLAVWAGDAGGLLRCVDLATKRPEVVLKGATAGVSAVATWPPARPAGSRLVASVGVDGFLRVHSASTRAQVASLYLKQPCVGVHWVPAPPGSGAPVAEGEEVEEEEVRAGKRKKGEKKDKKGKKKKR